MFNKINAFLQNVVIEKDANNYQEPWINPHIDLAEQLGYYGINDHGMQPQSAKIYFNVMAEDSLADLESDQMNFYVFLLSGRDFINKVKSDVNQFIVSYLITTHKITNVGILPPALMQDITYVRKQITLNNLIVREKGLKYFDRERLLTNEYVNSRMWKNSEVISSVAEKDSTILLVYGSQFENVDSLRQLGFSLKDIIGKIFTITTYDILKNGEVVTNENLLIQDARQQEKIHQVWDTAQKLDFSEASRRIFSGIRNIFASTGSWFQENMFSDICLSKINFDYGYFFGVDVKNILKNESVYYNMIRSDLENTFQEILKKSNIVEMRVVRQRVKPTQSVNQLGTPIFCNMVFDDAWEEGGEELVAVGGDLDQGFSYNQNFNPISELAIHQNADNRIRHFNGIDKDIKKKTYGYYRLGIYLTINDGAQQFLRELFFDLRKQYRWFLDYCSDINNSNIIDPRTNFLKLSAVRYITRKYESRPPWELLTNSIRNFISAITPITPELEQVLISLNNWMRPDSLTSESLLLANQVIENLVNALNNFLGFSERENSINIIHWFNEQLMDSEYDKTIHVDFGDMVIKPDLLVFPQVDSNRINETFSNSVLVDGVLMVQPKNVSCGDIRTELSSSTPENSKFGSNLLALTMSNNIVGKTNFGSSGSNSTIIPNSSDKAQAIVDSTSLLGEKTLSVIGVTLKPKTIDQQNTNTVSMENKIVNDYDGTTQLTGTKGKINSETTKLGESIRKLNVELMSTTSKILTPFAPGTTGKSGVRDVADSFVDVEKFKSQAASSIPEEARGALGVDEYKLNYMSGFQYFNKYVIDDNGDFDIKKREWVYLRPEKLQELVATVNKPVLCRLYKEDQKAQDSHLDIPVNNQFFFMNPVNN